MNFSFENGRGQKTRAELGNGRASARRNQGGQTMSRFATRTTGEKFVRPTRFSPVFSSENEAKEEFSAVILPFSDKELAESADVSTETVKCWRARRALPRGFNLMALVADFPDIAAWFGRRTGGLSNPQSEVELFGHLEQIMASDTPQGRAMRARLRQLLTEQGG